MKDEQYTAFIWEITSTGNMAIETSQISGGLVVFIWSSWPDRQNLFIKSCPLHINLHVYKPLNTTSTTACVHGCVSPCQPTDDKSFQVQLFYWKNKKGAVALVLGPHRLLDRQKNTGRKAVELTDGGIQACAEADRPLWSLIKVVIAVLAQMKNDPDCHTERVVCSKKQFSLDSGLEGTQLPRAASQGPPLPLPSPRDPTQLHLGAPSSPPLCCNGLGLSNARIRNPFWSLCHLSGVVRIYLALA